jgi:hypothetical protein
MTISERPVHVGKDDYNDQDFSDLLGDVDAAKDESSSIFQLSCASQVTVKMMNIRVS